MCDDVNKKAVRLCRLGMGDERAGTEQSWEPAQVRSACAAGQQLNRGTEEQEVAVLMNMVQRRSFVGMIGASASSIATQPGAFRG